MGLIQLRHMTIIFTGTSQVAPAYYVWSIDQLCGGMPSVDCLQLHRVNMGRGGGVECSA